MHSAFNQFAAFQHDAIDNKAFVEKGKLKMPGLPLVARSRSARAKRTTSAMLPQMSPASLYRTRAIG